MDNGGRNYASCTTSCMCSVIKRRYRHHSCRSVVWSRECWNCATHKSSKMFPSPSHTLQYCIAIDPRASPHFSGRKPDPPPTSLKKQQISSTKNFSKANKLSQALAFCLLLLLCSDEVGLRLALLLLLVIVFVVVLMLVVLLLPEGGFCVHILSTTAINCPHSF
jgi:hypothetical protein